MADESKNDTVAATHWRKNLPLILDRSRTRAKRAHPWTISVPMPLSVKISSSNECGKRPSMK